MDGRTSAQLGISYVRMTRDLTHVVTDINYYPNWSQNWVNSVPILSSWIDGKTKVVRLIFIYG